MQQVQALKKEIEKLDIRISRCNYYGPDSLNPDLCQCGLFKENHHPKAISNHETFGINKNITWNPKICTEEDTLTNAFGSIEFDDNDVSLVSKYARVFHRTESEKISKLLFKTWKLKPPKLVISVTGGASLKVNPKLREVFCNGVVKAAYSTQGWITTGGTYTGIMKYVGEAVKKDIRSLSQDEKIVLLGIPNWTTVARKEELILYDACEQPVQYKMKNFKRNRRVKSELLDPNHSHFILVDNSHQNTFGGEIDFRARLEAHIRKTVKVGEYDEVPVVMVVIEGGPNTARTVIQTIKKKIPCIFVNRSGRFSDIFSFIYETIIVKDIKEKSHINSDSNIFEFDISLRNDIEKMIKDEFPNKDKEKILADIEQIFHPKHRHLLSVFDLNADKDARDIDEIILKGLLKAKKSNYHSMIRLCLVWNRVDIARRFIFTEEIKDKIGSLDSLMEDAVIKNRVEFVELFLENGYNIKNFLNYGKLLKLYNNIPISSDLYRLLFDQVSYGLSNYKLAALGKRNRRICFTFNNIGTVTQKLMNNLYKHRFRAYPFSEIDHHKTREVIALKTVGLDRFRKLWKDKLNNKKDVLLNMKCELPEHELFMLSILLQRYDMALIFWREGINQIGASLIAALIFKRYLKKYDLEETKYIELEQKSKDFESLACRTLQTCDDSDELKAQQILMRRINEFSDITPIQISIAGNCMDFISHPTFQNLTMVIWYNKIIPDTPKLNIFLSILFPPIAPTVLHYRDKKPLEVGGKALDSKDDDDDSDNDEFEDGTEIVDKVEYLDTFKKKSTFRLNHSLDFFDSQKDLTYFEAIYHFFRTPLVKFAYNQFFYLFFILLFSYVMLCNFLPIDVSNENLSRVPEIIVIIFVFAYTSEEIRKVLMYDNKLFKAKFIAYLSDFLNGVQFLAIIFFIIGTILRFIPNHDCYIAARIILSIDLFFWYIKALVAFTFIKSLGPKITMIGAMMKELGYFMPVILLFMFAYGISSYAMQFHNAELNSELLIKIFFPGYFIIGGEHYKLEGMLAANEATCFENFTSIIQYSKNDECAEPNGTQVSLALYVLYLLFMFVLLQNLLIAIFSDVYDAVDKESDKVWKFQRYFLSHEYFHKPFLVPPFAILYHLYYFFKIIVKFFQKLCCRSYVPSRNSLISRIFLNVNNIYRPGFYYTSKNAEEENRFLKLESYLAKEVIIKIDKETKGTAINKVEENNEKMDYLHRKYELIAETRVDIENKLESIDEKFQLILKYLGKQPASSISIRNVVSAKKMLSQSKMVSQLKFPEVNPDTNNSKDIISFDEVSALAKKYLIKKQQEGEDRPSSLSGITPNIPQTHLPPSPKAQNNEHKILSGVYPGSNDIERFTLKDVYLPWSAAYVKYKPVKYTSENVLLSSKADIDQLAYSSGNLRPEISFNCYDTKFQVNRESLHEYEIKDGLPLNPLGRTGIYGRGNLYFWGPNYTVTAIFVRKNTDSEFEVIVSKNNESMEYPIILNENLHYDEKDSARTIILKLFDYEYLNSHQEKFEEILRFVQTAVKMDEYIVNSNLNTDNAWIETTVAAYFDGVGLILNDIPLRSSKYTWEKLNSDLSAKLEPESAKFYDKLLMNLEHKDNSIRY